MDAAEKTRIESELYREELEKLVATRTEHLRMVLGQMERLINTLRTVRKMIDAEPAVAKKVIEDALAVDGLPTN